MEKQRYRSKRKLLFALHFLHVLLPLFPIDRRVIEGFEGGEKEIVPEQDWSRLRASPAGTRSGQYSLGACML